VFVPAYDEATRANLACVGPFLSQAALRAEAATTVALHAALGAPGKTLVLFWSAISCRSPATPARSTWDRLRIGCPGENEPLTTPGARPGMIF
jgi:hypothetical protein